MLPQTIKKTKSIVKLILIQPKKWYDRITGLINDVGLLFRTSSFFNNYSPIDRQKYALIFHLSAEMYQKANLLAKLNLLIYLDSNNCWRGFLRLQRTCHCKYLKIGWHCQFNNTVVLKFNWFNSTIANLSSHKKVKERCVIKNFLKAILKKDQYKTYIGIEIILKFDLEILSVFQNYAED